MEITILSTQYSQEYTRGEYQITHTCMTFVGVSIIEHMVSLYLVILLYSILKYHGTILAHTTHPYKVHDIIKSGTNNYTMYFKHYETYSI